MLGQAPISAASISDLWEMGEPEGPSTQVISPLGIASAEAFGFGRARRFEQYGLIGFPLGEHLYQQWHEEEDEEVLVLALLAMEE